MHCQKRTTTVATVVLTILQGCCSSRQARWLWLLWLISIFTLVPNAKIAVPPQAHGQATCTEVIPPTVDKVDGALEYAHIKPGDILCIPAGERGNIKLLNLNGAPGSPITIRNMNGIVRITGSQFLMGGIGISASSYLHITGTGVSSQCGAPYPPDQQECGFDIGPTNKGIMIVNGTLDHLEIDHVTIHDTNPLTLTRGLVLHPLENQLITGFYVHHNYVHNTSAEGIYIGTEPNTQPFDILGKVQQVEVSYNLVEQTGYDGIKLKVVISDVKVHHNIVRHTALSKTPKHDAGIQMAFTVGEYYNNYVETALEGISMGRVLDHPGTKYYNNIVVGANVCLTAPEADAQIFNNTVVGCGQVGISAPGTEARVFSNISADVAGTPIEAGASNQFANLIGPSATLGFVNPAAHDYHLRAVSPAIDAGGSANPFLAFDYDDHVRPVGPRVDIGAYECVCTSGLTHKTYLPSLHR